MIGCGCVQDKDRASQVVAGQKNRWNRRSLYAVKHLHASRFPEA